MFKEFRAFIMKGNVLELTTAVIIAGAFGAIVTSLTNDVIMPPIGQLLGGVDFSELTIPLSDTVVDANGTVLEEGAAIRYGRFIQTVINFLIISFVIFLILRSYNQLTVKLVVEVPVPDPGPSEKDILLQIRDELIRRPL